VQFLTTEPVGIACGAFVVLFDGALVRNMAGHLTLTPEQWREVAKVANFRANRLRGILNISGTQLGRATRRVFGRTPQAWLFEEQLSSAAELLKQRRSVKAVAYEVGFAQVSHFCRRFKAFYGVPPSVFIDNSIREVTNSEPRLPR
jgi:AraC-like DNA-binding protein